MSSDEERYDAMLEFLGCFPTISGSIPSDIEDLNDGVIMFEVMSDISPDYFDPNRITKNPGSNYALKAGNLRKLRSNLETFYHEVLEKSSSSFDSISSDISSIARDSNKNKEGIATFCELIIAAAVTCENKSIYVGWIMNMSEENQLVMREIIQESMQMLEDLEMEDDPNDDDDDDESGGLSGHQHSSGHGLDDSSLSDDGEGLGLDNLKEYAENLYVGMEDIDDEYESRDIIKERNAIRKDLEEANKKLQEYEKKYNEMEESTESSQKKLSALTEDLQERLETRETELMDAEAKLLKKTRMLEDAEVKVGDLMEKNATIADELDIANAKAAQLRKAENTIEAYRKKLAEFGVINQQMSDQEYQSQRYLEQIMELEAETKKIPQLEKDLEKAKRNFIKVQKEKDEATEYVSSKNTELSKLKSDLRASVNSKKMFEEELNELRYREEQSSTDIPNVNIPDVPLKNIVELEEKSMRLEIENKKLKEQLGIDIGNTEFLSIGSRKVDNATKAVFESKIQELQSAIKKKESNIKKLTTDKDRLESYTKKTLAKFQEKYLVALQECKAKLKEKHDKIEELERIIVSEKSNHKREEKLLSSAMYELGLSIMQQKLKER